MLGSRHFGEIHSRQISRNLPAKKISPMPRGIGVLASYCIAAEDQQSHCQGRIGPKWSGWVLWNQPKWKAWKYHPLFVSYIRSENPIRTLLQGLLFSEAFAGVKNNIHAEDMSFHKWTWKSLLQIFFRRVQNDPGSFEHSKTLFCPLELDCFDVFSSKKIIGYWWWFRNPANHLEIYKTLWIVGYVPYKLVQDFFHQKYPITLDIQANTSWGERCLIGVWSSHTSLEGGPGCLG